MQHKLVTRLSAALYGRAEPIPAESTWTHINQNFAMTVFRALVNNLGLEAMPGAVVDDVALLLTAVAEADDEFFKVVTRIRKKENAEYLGCKRNIEELTFLKSLIKNTTKS